MNERMSRSGWFFILVLSSVLALGCSGTKADGIQLTNNDNGKEISSETKTVEVQPAAGDNGKQVNSTADIVGGALTESDNGKEVSVKKGQMITVRLEANPTTGYGWEVSEIDPQVLTQNGEKTYEQASQSKNLVGGGGWETFTFTAQQTGETTLKLIYRRSWEKGVEPIKTFEVKIRVVVN